jgi:hypothetical protein
MNLYKPRPLELACLLVGLVVLAGAGASIAVWLAVQVMQLLVGMTVL